MELVRIDSQRIEHTLQDLWNARYPKLASLKHKYLQTDCYSGSQFMGANVLSYKAALLMQDIYHKSKVMRDRKRAQMSQLRGIIHREIENVATHRLTMFANISKKHYIKNVMNSQIEDYKTRKELEQQKKDHPEVSLNQTFHPMAAQAKELTSIRTLLMNNAAPNQKSKNSREEFESQSFRKIPSKPELPRSKNVLSKELHDRIFIKSNHTFLTKTRMKCMRSHTVLTQWTVLLAQGGEYRTSKMGETSIKG
jgi:hypothetical protein